MARSQGIPARFEIGFPLPPADKHASEIAGYHCWAEFFARNTGWVPVDISEAWKAKEKSSYFFGSIDANRVQPQRQIAIVVLGSRSRGLPQPVLTEGHFDVIDSRTRHLAFGYVS